MHLRHGKLRQLNLQDPPGKLQVLSDVLKIFERKFLNTYIYMYIYSVQIQRRWDLLLGIIKQFCYMYNIFSQNT